LGLFSGCNPGAGAVAGQRPQQWSLVGWRVGDSPKRPACKEEHPIFDRRCKFHPKHVLEKPKFGPTLPLAIAKEKLAKERRAKEKAIEERRKVQREADKNMVDA